MGLKQKWPGFTDPSLLGNVGKKCMQQRNGACIPCEQKLVHTPQQSHFGKK